MLFDCTWDVQVLAGLWVLSKKTILNGVGKKKRLSGWFFFFFFVKGRNNQGEGRGHTPVVG